MAASSTIKILDTMEWAKKLNFGRRSAIGNSLEPAKTSANTVLQTILGAPFTWRWNRAVTGFVCTAGQQDYTIVNWSATTALSLGWLTVDDAGNSQAVTTAGTTGGAAPSWNHTKTGTTNDGSVTWTNLGPIGVPVSQTYSFGWIETTSAQDISLATPKWFQLQTNLCLGLDSAQSRPRMVAAQGDDGQGNITFRLMPVPDAAYPVAITVQKKPVPVSNIQSGTWAPIPDEYSHIYNWGFLSLMYMFADDPRFGAANQKFVAQLLAAQQGLTQTQINIFLGNWQAITGQPLTNANANAQGAQARGV